MVSPQVKSTVLMSAAASNTLVLSLSTTYWSRERVRQQLLETEANHVCVRQALEVLATPLAELSSDRVGRARLDADEQPEQRRDDRREGRRRFGLLGQSIEQVLHQRGLAPARSSRGSTRGRALGREVIRRRRGVVRLVGRVHELEARRHHAS